MSDSISNNQENSLHNLLNTYSLEEILFVLYCYAHEQAKIVKPQNNYLEKPDWEKLVKILDMACTLIEESTKDTDKDNFYLIY